MCIYIYREINVYILRLCICVCMYIRLYCTICLYTHTAVDISCVKNASLNCLHFDLICLGADR